jgi:hypothetical protein
MGSKPFVACNDEGIELFSFIALLVVYFAGAVAATQHWTKDFKPHCTEQDFAVVSGHLHDVVYRSRAMVVFLLQEEKQDRATQYIMLPDAMGMEFAIAKALLKSGLQCELRVQVWRHRMQPDYFYVRKLECLYPPPRCVKVNLYLMDDTKYIVRFNDAEGIASLLEYLRQHSFSERMSRDLAHMTESAGIERA